MIVRINLNNVLIFFYVFIDPRGEDGKPITKPRNLLAGTNRSGQGKKGYFNVPESIYKGDEYQDPFKL